MILNSVESIPQYDGNISIDLSLNNTYIQEDSHYIKVHTGFRPNKVHTSRPPSYLKNLKREKQLTKPISLPTVIMYNMRSFFPKQNNFCDDFLEREADLAFLTEVWEKKENSKHKFKIEKMLEMKGINYISTPRPGKKGEGVQQSPQILITSHLRKFIFIFPEELKLSGAF